MKAWGERDGGLFLINEFLSISADLALNDFLYQINGYIHISAGFLCADGIALDRDCYFDLLPVLLRAQRYDYFGVRREEMFQLAYLLFNGSLQTWSYLNISSCYGITIIINSFSWDSDIITYLLYKITIGTYELPNNLS